MVSRQRGFQVKGIDVVVIDVCMYLIYGLSHTLLKRSGASGGGVMTHAASSMLVCMPGYINV